MAEDGTNASTAPGTAVGATDGESNFNQDSNQNDNISDATMTTTDTATTSPLEATPVPPQQAIPNQKQHLCLYNKQMHPLHPHLLTMDHNLLLLPMRRSGLRTIQKQGSQSRGNGIIVIGL